MAFVPESSTWEAGVYQFEETDVLQGGPAGIDNTPSKQLANRTVYLKTLVDALSAGKQPLDADLTAIAALVSAADKMPYATGAGAWALATLSAFARTLLDDADAATARTTLGAQASDATLTALAAVVTAANKLIYATGADTFATTDLSVFGRTLIDDADAAAARTTIGLGTVATLASSTDGTLAANSDANIPTQKAVKTYVDGIMAANDAMVFKGVIDCSTTPNYPAADRGHTYRVSVAGKIGGAAGPNVEAGDILLCITDGTAAGTHATVGANWGIIQLNIDGALTTADLGSTVQAYDADLAAIAALVSAADKMPYATGPGAWSLATLSAFARTLLDDADAATARTTLGAQASDATLTALAGIVTAANKLIYATGADTFATTDLSAFARTLLDDADASTMRSTLGAIGATYSIGANGYIAFPSWFAGGAIIQWGKTNYVNTSGGTITFPLAFSNACLAITCNVSEASGSYAIGQAIGPTLTNFSTAIYTAASGSAPAANNSVTVDFHWIAIGH